MFPDWYKEAERLYQDGLPYYKIAQIIGVHRKTVSHWLRKGGYKSNPLYVRQIDMPRKYEVDDNAFDTIDTEEKAYWLGFLFADGCIHDAKNALEISLQERDRQHLYKLQSFLKATYPVKRRVKKTKTKEYVGYRIVVQSKKIKEDLIRHGCTPQKSLTLKFPSEDTVPRHLIRHFVRGYFDGDGCITKSNGGRHLALEILGTEEFLKSLIEVIGVESRIHPFNHVKGTFRIQYFTKKADQVMKWMYDGASIYLDRKHDLYTQFAPYDGYFVKTARNMNIVRKAGEIGEG